MIRFLALCFFLLCSAHSGFAQDDAIMLSVDDFQTHQRLFLSQQEGWLFRQGNNITWSKKAIDTSG